GRPMVYRRAGWSEVRRKPIQDRVQLPRLYLAWLTPPQFKPGDAELDVLSQLLAGGKNSRLYKRLVYDLQIAQDVTAFQASKQLSSEYNIIVTARPTPQGTTVAAQMDRIRGIVDEEIKKIQQTPPAAHEFQRAINQIESSFYDRMERIGGDSGVADQMNAYYTFMGEPNYFSADLARYHAVTLAEVPATATKYLPLDKRVELIV